MASIQPVRRDGPPSAQLGIAAFGVLAALALTALAAIWWFDPARWAYDICALHRTTGLHCPGCGATRATHELLHGRFVSALHHNALWVLSLPIVLYAAASELHRRFRGRPLPGEPTRRTWFFWAVGAAALLFGILRNLPMEPLAWLSPPGPPI